MLAQLRLHANILSMQFFNKWRIAHAKNGQKVMQKYGLHEALP